MITIFLGLFLGILLVGLGIYLLYGWLFSRILQKCGHPDPHKAYVPIAQFLVFLEVTHQNKKLVWLLLFAFIPVIGIFAGIALWAISIIGLYRLSKRFDETGWFTLMLIIPPVSLWGWWYLGRKKITLKNEQEAAILPIASRLIAQRKSSSEIQSLMEQAGIPLERAESLSGLSQYYARTNAPISAGHEPIATWIILALSVLSFLLMFGGGGSKTIEYSRSFNLSDDPTEALQQMLNSDEVKEIRKLMDQKEEPAS